MEVQVNVARDTGEPVHGSYAGTKWHGFTDGLQIWKPFRIPWNADVDPKYEDRDIKFDLSKHVEGIGMTGWDFVNKRSLWVGFDFDSIIGHKEGLTQGEIDDLIRKMSDVDFVSIFRSTSGNGFHVYVFIEDTGTATNTHTEHAAIARAILSKLSALTGIQLEAKVDAMGGILWVWHRKSVGVATAFQCLKQGEKLKEIPPNWREYLSVVAKRGAWRAEPTSIDQLASYRNNLILEEDHLKLIQWFESKNDVLWWYDDNKQMLVCHTYDLKRAHLELKLRGVFETVATGKDQGHDQNCFCFPIQRGGWIVRRHSIGANEAHATWYKDRKGYTTSYFNTQPNLGVAAKFAGGIEGDKEYHFRTLTGACTALRLMGIDCDPPPGMNNRPTALVETKEKIKISMVAIEHDDPPEGWIHKAKTWERYFFKPQVTDEVELPDDYLRHLVSQRASAGWFLNTNNNWVETSRQNITSALLQIVRRDKLDPVLGTAVLNNWQLVNKPFQPEYPGNREWNKDAAQFRYTSKRGKHPTWDKILEHIGSGLDEHVAQNVWCKDNGILGGYIYLLSWVSSCCLYPTEPLPYLFIYGPQNCGKSILHEALQLLFTRGVSRADQALTNPTGFNGELAGSILCVVEETNLTKKGIANDRIKDWVTGKTISIHNKGKTPYDLPNTSHWIQCANSIDYCPVFPGDTRITLIRVEKFAQEIPKSTLLLDLEREAEAFLYTVLNFELPEPTGRLRIPTIETQEKVDQMDYNKDALIRFIEEKVHKINGHKVLFSDFYKEFQDWLPFNERSEWTSRKVAKELPFCRGKAGANGQLYVGNVSLNQGGGDLKEFTRFTRNGDRLVQDD